MVRFANHPTPLQLNRLLNDAGSTRDLLELHRQHGPACDGHNRSMCWVKLRQSRDCAWLRSNGGELLFALRDQTHTQAGTLNPRGVASTTHALATLDLKGRAWECLWTALELRALACVDQLNPQELANIAWALVKASRPALALFDAIAVEAARRVREFNPQSLANTE